MRWICTVFAVAIAAGPASALNWQAGWDALLHGEPTRTGETQANGGVRTLPHATAVQPNMGAGVFEVTGYGVAPDHAGTPAQAKLLAVGAAKLDALHKLAAILEGAEVRSEEELRDYVQTRYAVRQETSAMLRGVRVVATRYAPDGTAEVDVRLVLDSAGAAQDFGSPQGYEIVAAHPAPAAIPPARTAVLRPETEQPAPTNLLTAFEESRRQDPAPDPLARESVDLQRLFEDARQESSLATQDTPAAVNAAAGQVEPPPGRRQLAKTESKAPSGVDVGPVRIEPNKFTGQYTDLIVDARGYAVDTAQPPRVETLSGNQIFPFNGGMLESFAPPQEPAVRFIKSEPEARLLPGYGGRPLSVEIDGVAEDGAFLMSEFRLLGLQPLLRSRLARGEGYVLIWMDE